MLSISGIGCGDKNIYNQSTIKNSVHFEKRRFSDVHDELVKNDKSNNGKFDLSEAGKNFFKGILSPITAAIEHPIATLGLVAGTVAASSIAPVLGPALAIGFGAYSLFQAGKGCYDAVKNYSNGNYDAAEKSFTTVGEGTIGTILSALGVKQGAKVAKEAKLMSELNTTSLSSAQKAEIAANVKGAGFYNNLKESLSLFTSKSGLNATFNQFKPKMLKTRFQEFKNFFDKSKWSKEETGHNPKVKSLEERIKEFVESPEGKRRAALSDKQIETEVKALYEDVFDRLGIPKEQRPKLVIESDNASIGGSYSKGGHKIKFNPKAYKSGVMEIEDVMMHEGTHCKEALLRAGIPQDRVDAIVVDELVGRIRNGEAEEIIKGGSFLGADMAKPPKMETAMKEDFIQFAKDNLYTKDNALTSALENYDTQVVFKKSRYFGNSFELEKFEKAEKTLTPILNKLKSIIRKNPDFAKQYGSEQEALEALVEYSRAHNFRYRYFTNTKINKSILAGDHADYINVEPLSGDALVRAEQSLVDDIATIEGNGRASGFKIFGPSEQEFNQYQFSPEEVLAQKNGNNYLIEKMTAKINQLKNAGTLTPEQEAYMNQVIKKAKIVIEYKTKGLEYYKKYTQMINNPNDAELVKTVEAMGKELEILKGKMSQAEWSETVEVIKKFAIPDHSSVLIPGAAIYQLLNSKKSE